MTLPFDQPAALALNEARMGHVKNLNLIQPGMRVLDVGAGVGHLSKRLLDWGCEVVALEGRAANVEEARRRYPGLDIRVCDLERDKPVAEALDAMLFFGTLYHLQHPSNVLEFITAPLALVSTIVTDSASIDHCPIRESNSDDQSMRVYGCRPTPGYVFWLMTQCGYTARASVPQPNHPDYQWSLQNDGRWRRDGHLLRQFFIFERSR